MSTRIARAFVIVPLACVMMSASFPSAWAQDRPALRLPARLTVTGESEARLAPELAIVNLTVLREAETSREGLTATNEAVSKLLVALKEAGVAERDMQTTGLNIQPRIQRPTRQSDVKEDRIVGYTVTNSLTVRIRDLSKVGNVLDTAVTLGVNRSTGLRFVNEDVTDGLREARKRAVADALDRAKTLAESAGVRVGRIISMNERSLQPRPYPAARQTAARAYSTQGVPVASGENAYKVTVSVVFEIEQ